MMFSPSDHMLLMYFMSYIRKTYIGIRIPKINRPLKISESFLQYLVLLNWHFLLLLTLESLASLDSWSFHLL